MHSMNQVKQKRSKHYTKIFKDKLAEIAEAVHQLPPQHSSSWTGLFSCVAVDSNISVSPLCKCSSPFYTQIHCSGHSLASLHLPETTDLTRPGHRDNTKEQCSAKKITSSTWLPQVDFFIFSMAVLRNFTNYKNKFHTQEHMEGLSPTFSTITFCLSIKTLLYTCYSKPKLRIYVIKAQKHMDNSNSSS